MVGPGRGRQLELGSWTESILVVCRVCARQLWRRTPRAFRTNQACCPGARARDEKIPPVHARTVTELSALLGVKSLIIHLSGAVLANVGVVPPGVKQTGGRREARSPLCNVLDPLS